MKKLSEYEKKEVSEYLKDWGWDEKETCSIKLSESSLFKFWKANKEMKIAIEKSTTKLFSEWDEIKRATKSNTKDKLQK